MQCRSLVIVLSAYPTMCGDYGICTNGQCTCLFQSNTDSYYLKPVDDRKANLCCMPLIPISCQDMQHHHLFTLIDVSYFDESHTYRCEFKQKWLYASLLTQLLLQGSCVQVWPGRLQRWMFLGDKGILIAISTTWSSSLQLHCLHQGAIDPPNPLLLLQTDGTLF